MRLSQQPVVDTPLTQIGLLLKPDTASYRLLSEGVPYTVEIGPHGGIHYTIG